MERPLDRTGILNHLDIGLLEHVAGAVDEADVSGRIAGAARHGPKHRNAIDDHGKAAVWTALGVIMLGGCSPIGVERHPGSKGQSANQSEDEKDALRCGYFLGVHVLEEHINDPSSATAPGESKCELPGNVHRPERFAVALGVAGVTEEAFMTEIHEQQLAERTHVIVAYRQQS